MSPTLDVTDRARFLSELYTLSEGDTERTVPLNEIAQRLNLPPDQAQMLADSICAGLPGSAHHGLVQCEEEGIRLTQEGMEFFSDTDAAILTE